MDGDFEDLELRDRERQKREQRREREREEDDEAQDNETSFTEDDPLLNRDDSDPDSGLGSNQGNDRVSDNSSLEESDFDGTNSVNFVGNRLSGVSIGRDNSIAAVRLRQRLNVFGRRLTFNPVTRSSELRAPLTIAIRE